MFWNCSNDVLRKVMQSPEGQRAVYVEVGESGFLIRYWDVFGRSPAIETLEEFRRERDRCVERKERMLVFKGVLIILLVSLAVTGALWWFWGMIW